MRKFLLLACIAGFGLSGFAHAGEPLATPILLLDSGSHSAPITRVVASPIGQQLLTVSDDKSARLWDTATGRKIRQFRQPIGAQMEGQLTAAAISPDGKLAAIGGFTGAEWDQVMSVYVFEVASGKLLKRIPDVGDLVAQLAFSPDGRHLAAVSLSNPGLNVYRVVDWARVARDSTFAETAESYRGAFLPDGRFVLSSWDGNVRLYDATFRLITKVAARSGRRPHGIAVSPDGALLALGYSDVASVDLLSGRDLSFLYSANTQGMTGSLSSVAWSKDGKRLYAAGRYDWGRIVMWDDAGRAAPRYGDSVGNTALDLHRLPDGQLAAGGSDAAWVTFDANGKRNLYQAAGSSRFSRSSAKTLLVSKDGSEIAFDYEPTGRVQARLNINSRQVTSDSGVGLLAAQTQSATLRIDDWDQGFAPTLNGIPLRNLLRNERVRAAALTPHNDGVVLGANYGLRLYDSRGQLRWLVHSQEVSAVNVSGDNQKVIASFRDGTIRWYRISDGKEILAFFPHADRQRWVMWTPEGYYDASPGGESLIGWHLNQGKDKEARFIPNSQLYDVFYRPDIVQAKFKGEDISGLITLTAEQALKSPPPEIVLTKVPASSSLAKDQVCYKITSTGGGIGEVRVFQNGKLVKSDGFYREAVARKEDSLKLASVNSESVTRSLRALKLKQTDLPNLPASHKGNVVEECQTIEPIAGDNELGVVAFNAQNTVQSSMAEGKFTSTRPAEEPHLHILAIGIDQFADKTATLKFAGKDAKDFLELVGQKTGTLFKPGNVHTATLGNAQASKQGILNKIDELSASIKSGDTFILFVASHGVLLGNQYYLVSAGYDGTADLKNLVGSNEIVELSKKIKALNQLYVFDTCHAGGVDNLIGGLYDARMSVLAKKMGLHIYAAAGGLQEALDGYQGNGLFTHALINSLKEPVQTDSDKDGKISVMELGKAAKDKTTTISTKIGHPQTPTMIHFGKDVAVAGGR